MWLEVERMMLGCVRQKMGTASPVGGTWALVGWGAGRRVPKWSTSSTWSTWFTRTPGQASSSGGLRDP
jgi:hypothetical protein